MVAGMRLGLGVEEQDRAVVWIRIVSRPCSCMGEFRTGTLGGYPRQGGFPLQALHPGLLSGSLHRLLVVRIPSHEWWIHVLQATVSPNSAPVSACPLL